MKKLLTRLLLFVALVMFAFPSGAKDLYLQGKANVQDATEPYGWRVSPSFDPLEVPIASDGCYYLRSFDIFKLSYCDNKPTGWDNDGGFNKTLVHFSSSGTSDNNGGDISVGEKYIKLAPRTDGKFDVTIQDSKFEIGEVVGPDKLYYFCSEGKDNWAAGGSKQVQVGSKLELTAASGGTSYFVFGTDPTLSWSSDKLYALGSSQDVSNDGEYTATYKAGTAAFEVNNGTYTITVTEFNPGVSVKFTVAKKGEEPPVPADLYVFSNNSGNWNNTTGGRALTAGQTIEFSAAKQIYFVFGPKQTFDWNSNADKALLYGAQYEREVADGETRVAHHGNSQVFKIGSGKWNLTVTEFVKGETVTFTVKRLGDADIPADGYVEYVLYDETDNTAFELEWDINAGCYRGKVTDGVQAALGANKKGHLGAAA